MKYGLNPRFNTHNRIYTTEFVYLTAGYTKYNETVPDHAKVDVKIITDWDGFIQKNTDEIYKCAAVDTDLSKIQKAKEEIAEIDSIEVMSSTIRNFETMNKGITKGRAVERLASYYNISPEEIIGIGNNENDMPMLRYAGLGVAMGNAEEELKIMADYIAPTNDEDGVAAVIEKFVLNN